MGSWEDYAFWSWCIAYSVDVCYINEISWILKYLLLLLLCFGQDNYLWVTVDIQETYSCTWWNLFLHIYQGLFNEILWTTTQNIYLQVWLLSGLFPLATSTDSSVFLLQMLVTYPRTPSDSTCLEYHFFSLFHFCVFISLCLKVFLKISK